jgi:hypothetical protein
MRAFALFTVVVTVSALDRSRNIGRRAMLTNGAVLAPMATFLPGTLPARATLPAWQANPAVERATQEKLSTVVETYGEITTKGLRTFAPYVDQLKRVRGDVHFLDLGSGFGSSLLRFHTLYPSAKSVTGVEFVQERHDAAIASMRAKFPDAPVPQSDSEYHFTTAGTAFHLYRGDFFDGRFTAMIRQARLIYCANLLFENELNEKLYNLLRTNPCSMVLSCLPLIVGSQPVVLDQSWNPKSTGSIWLTWKPNGVEGDLPSEFGRQIRSARADSMPAVPT